MEPKIRRMRRRDVAAVVAIIVAHDVDDGAVALREFKRRARSRQRWRDPNARYYVALLNGVVAGVSGVVADDEEGENVWWLGWFYVAEGTRGQGLGKALFDRAVARARKRGGRKMFVDTSSTEGYAAARRFYEAQGCTEEGRLLDYYAPGDHQVLYGFPL
jgi:GNAT superfamily N-acetyltransferase